MNCFSSWGFAYHLVRFESKCPKARMDDLAVINAGQLLFAIMQRQVLTCVFCVVVTPAFRLLYVFIVIEHNSLRIIHCNVATYPTAAWTLQQLGEAIPSDHGYRFLIHDRDGIFSPQLDRSITHMGLRHSADRNAPTHRYE
jgi:hypothetical protein